MSAAAKGFFPGRLRKKLLKKTVKYKKELQKYDLEEQLFGEKTEKTADDIQLMFVEDSDQVSAMRQTSISDYICIFLFTYN